MENLFDKIFNRDVHSLTTKTKFLPKQMFFFFDKGVTATGKGMKGRVGFSLTKRYFLGPFFPSTKPNKVKKEFLGALVLFLSPFPPVLHRKSK